MCPWVPSRAWGVQTVDWATALPASSWAPWLEMLAGTARTHGKKVQPAVETDIFKMDTTEEQILELRG